MLDESPQMGTVLAWLELGETLMDTDQQHALVEAILQTFPEEPPLSLFVRGLPGMKPLQHYAVANNLEEIVGLFVERMKRENGHLQVFVAAFHKKTLPSRDPEIVAFREAFSRVHNPERTQAFRPRNKRWERSQEIAANHIHDVYLVDMFPQRGKLGIAADALAKAALEWPDGAQGGYIPLVAVVRGLEADLPTEFERRFEHDFLALIEERQMAGAPGNSIRMQNKKRLVESISIEDGSGMSPQEQLAVLRRRFCEKLPVVADPVSFGEVGGGLALEEAAEDAPPPYLAGAESEANEFHRELAQAAKGVNRRAAIFLHVRASGAEPWYRAFLETWISDWEFAVQNMRFDRPLVHVICFTDAPATDGKKPEVAPKPGGLRRLFSWMDRQENQESPFEEAWLAVSEPLVLAEKKAQESQDGINTKPIIPEIWVLPGRQEIRLNDLQTWCGTVKSSADMSDEDWRFFEMHLQDIFNGERGPVRLNGFQRLLSEFPDTPPERGENGN